MNLNNGSKPSPKTVKRSQLIQPICYISICAPKLSATKKERFHVILAACFHPHHFHNKFNFLLFSMTNDNHLVNKNVIELKLLWVENRNIRMYSALCSLGALISIRVDELAVYIARSIVVIFNWVAFGQIWTTNTFISMWYCHNNVVSMTIISRQTDYGGRTFMWKLLLF